MAGNYSFLSHPFEVILRNAHAFLPGIDKVVAVYFDSESGTIQARCVTREFQPGHIEAMELGDSKVILQKQRQDKNPCIWCSKENIPFITTPPVNKQVQIMDEYSNIILQLRFPNENDEYQDILFFYFKENISNFGVSTNNKLLSTENKSIISFILYNFLKTTFSIIRSDNLIHNTVTESTISLMSRYSNIWNELERSRRNYGESLMNLCQHYITDFAEQFGITCTLEERATERIRTYTGDIRHLLKIIENAIIFAKNIDKIRSPKVIRIYGWHLNFDQFAYNEICSKVDVLVGEKYKKTWLLLEKLENAAREVKSNNKKLISENVGSHCPTPISAPAITDAIKKHNAKILYLMNRYPERWTIIRNEFRPVRKLMVGDG
ncbi:MAG: hypothetical protein NT175_06815 [Bacteroidetes bacterium]|nr:hypothetical protein [Bacteroidota bacterium]